MGLFARPSTEAASAPAPAPAPAPRRLFLDDDPQRAEVFLAENPEAVWVQTVVDCIARLAEPWAEVHLDHDLGGEHFVDHARTDCGMEVVRWLCLDARPHLRSTQFYIHSHNPQAATTMGLQLLGAGYQVELRPFGAPPLPPLPDDGLHDDSSILARLLRRLRDLLLGRRDDAETYGYSGFGIDTPAMPGDPAAPPPPVEKLDLSWTRPGANLPRGVPKAADLPEPVEKLDLSWGKPAGPATPPRPRASPATTPAEPASTPDPTPRDDDIAFDPY